MIYVCSTSNIVHPPFKDSLWKKSQKPIKKKLVSHIKVCVNLTFEPLPVVICIPAFSG